MLTLVVLWVHVTAADFSAFYGCYESGLCDRRFYRVVATDQDCSRLMTQDYERRLNASGFTSAQDLGVYSGCINIRAAVRFQLCPRSETLHTLTECETIPFVLVPPPSTLNAAGRTPRPLTPRRGVSVLRVQP